MTDLYVLKQDRPSLRGPLIVCFIGAAAAAAAIIATHTFWKPSFILDVMYFCAFWFAPTGLLSWNYMNHNPFNHVTTKLSADAVGPILNIVSSSGIPLNNVKEALNAYRLAREVPVDLDASYEVGRGTLPATPAPVPQRAAPVAAPRPPMPAPTPAPAAETAYNEALAEQIRRQRVASGKREVEINA